MSGLLDDPAGFLAALVLKIPALLLAVTVHEVAHAIVADRLGDPTPRRTGRITLNPLPHLDPLGALAFVVAGFGWARPVEVDAANFRHPVRDMTWVAAAGPVTNLIVAFVGLVGFALARQAGLPALLGEPIGGMLLWTFQFNLALGIFNLIPLPPLDGGHFLPYVLPGPAAAAIRQLEQCNYSRYPVAGAVAASIRVDPQVTSVCGKVTVPGVASAARRARSRYALGSTPQSFADSMRL